MNVRKTNDEIMQALKEHFPDGKIIVIMSDKRPVEEILGPSLGPGDIDEMFARVLKSNDIDEPGMKIQTTFIDLNLLEPESGIYAGMSPHSRKVYVFIDQEEFGYG